MDASSHIPETISQQGPLSSPVMPDRSISWAVLRGRRVQHATWDENHIGCDRREKASIELRQDYPWSIEDYGLCRRPYCQRMWRAHQDQVPDELAARRASLLRIEQDLQD